jgi:iron complex outermembrane receptor protein
MRSIEAGVEHRLRSRYQISVSGFANRIEDLIEQAADPSSGEQLFSNAPAITTRGMELEIHRRWNNGAQGSVSHTVQHSKNTHTGSALTNSPKHLAKAGVSIPLAGRALTAAIEGQYTSRRRTASQSELGGFLVANATLLSTTLAGRLDASASVYNLFDKRYADSGGAEHVQAAIPQDGRSFRVKVVYRLGANR